MVTRLTYSNIKDFNPFEVIEALRTIEKYPLSQLKASDLIVSSNLDKLLNDLNYNDIYFKGIYILFDTDNHVKYVGKSKNGFYGRLMGHLYTVAKPGWGWNAILRKLGGNRLNIPHDELTTVDHEYDLPTLLEYRLVLIDTEDLLSPQQLGWLEKFLMKAFRVDEEEYLLNTRIGWLSREESNTPIKQLLDE
jgi:hypothetical protein